MEHKGSTLQQPFIKSLLAFATSSSIVHTGNQELLNMSSSTQNPVAMVSHSLVNMRFTSLLERMLGLHVGEEQTMIITITGK